MHKTFDFKKYVEYKVYSVTTIKKGYGFRVLLTFVFLLYTTPSPRDSSSSRIPSSA